MKLSLASAAPVLFATVLAAPLAAQAPPAASPAPQSASAPPAAAMAATATPRDPKSPIPGFPDGRGPSGPVQLTILEPTADQLIPIPPPAAGQPAATGAPVEVKVDLKNYELFKDPATGQGQHLAIVLDNLPYFAYFDATKPWLFKRVPKGTHTLRIFPVRPWGESIKEPGAFAMVTFHVGQKDGRYAPTPGAPLLTASRPKGKYSGAEARRILFDFYVTNCPVAEKTVPNTCRVRYRLDDRPEVIVDKWEPMWWEGLAPGRHEYVIGLTRDEKVVQNGPFNLVKVAFEIDQAGAGPAATRPVPAGGAAPAPGTNVPGPGVSGEPPHPGPGISGQPAATPPATH